MTHNRLFQPSSCLAGCLLFVQAMAAENLGFVLNEGYTTTPSQLIEEGDGYTIESFYIVEKPPEELIAEVVKPIEPVVKTPETPKKEIKEEVKTPKPIKRQNLEYKCEDCVGSDKELLNSAVQDLQAQVDELKDMLSQMESNQEMLNDQIEAVERRPSEQFLAKTNFLLVGTAYAFWAYQNRHNSTFGNVIDPVFLWRYGDNFLYEMKLDIILTDCRTDIALIYGTMDYIFTDWLIGRAGKYSTPLGLVWEKMTTGWINKLPTLPLPYNPRGFALTPAADVGIDIRGAVPAFHWFDWGCFGDVDIPAVIAYDFWLGNGPSEVDGAIALDCAFDDNNYNKSFGTRLALRPQPFREIGFSAERAQWNNNRRRRPFDYHDRLYYNAFVIDLNWKLTDESKLMGEYIWTEYDTVFRKYGRCRDIDVVQSGWWIQYSSFLGFIGQRPYCCVGEKAQTFWDDTEFVFRWCGVNSDIPKRSGHQYSVGLNYYILNTFLVKAAYDVNTGPRLCGDNRVTFQAACAY